MTEPRREKTGLRVFRPGLTQTGRYSHRSRLEALNFGFKNKTTLGSENKADRGYREAGMRFCFRIYNCWFSDVAHSMIYGGISVLWNLDFIP